MWRTTWVPHCSQHFSFWISWLHPRTIWFFFSKWKVAKAGKFKFPHLQRNLWLLCPAAQRTTAGNDRKNGTTEKRTIFAVVLSPLKERDRDLLLPRNQFRPCLKGPVGVLVDTPIPFLTKHAAYWYICLSKVAQIPMDSGGCCAEENNFSWMDTFQSEISLQEMREELTFQNTVFPVPVAVPLLFKKLQEIFQERIVLWRQPGHLYFQCGGQHIVSPRGFGHWRCIPLQTVTCCRQYNAINFWGRRTKHGDRYAFLLLFIRQIEMMHHKQLPFVPLRSQDTPRLCIFFLHSISRTKGVKFYWRQDWSLR